MKRVAISVLLVLAIVSPGWTQSDNIASWAVEAGLSYRVVHDVVYLQADGHESKLDVIVPRGEGPHPTLIYIHGGGWVGGSKETVLLRQLPYLEMGWAVVNVGYRLARVALAPAAVEDARCALRWVHANAEEYGFDTNRIVTSGHSAGGHLSLTTAILPASAGLDRRCPGVDPSGTGRVATKDIEMSVAAVVNWFGITDVGDLLEGENAKTYAVAWMGSLPDREEIAERVSPLTYVRPGLPPILTIHGDADLIVPYDHSLRLHAALEKAGVENQLHTVPGGGHGGFSLEQSIEAFAVIREFLARTVSDAE